MEFTSSRKRHKRVVVEDSEALQRLQMYRVPPAGEISLEDFDSYAIARIKLLREVESAGIKYKKGDKEDKYGGHIRSHLKKFMEEDYTNVTKVNVKHDRHFDRRRDHISHFILRLVYCQSEDLRRWFIAQETELFRVRLSIELENEESAQTFLNDNNLRYTPISVKEKKEKQQKLSDSAGQELSQSIEQMDYFKIPFTEALDLVRGRKVYLEKGYAYIPKKELSSIIAAVFRQQLSLALAITVKAVPYLEEDERLLPRLRHLSHQYLGEDYSNKNKPGERISPSQLDYLSKTSFPLCARQLHQALRENHHLKHGGRMQYGLYLKGIGVSMEDSIMFWRSEFTKIMDIEKFEKQHPYNIRHNYGKEGKRTNYTPYSCMKIIMSNHPGPGDYHGCPFRHTDHPLLAQRLAAYGVKKEKVSKIMELVKGQHYQPACQRYFEAVHGLEEDSVKFALQHPNQYFDESRKVHLQSSTGEPAAVKSVPSSGSQPVAPVKPKKMETEDFDAMMEDFPMGDIEAMEGIDNQ